MPILVVNRTSLIQHRIYGRDAEKNSIIKLMTEDKSDGVLVLPIIGIGGIGKTALAQLVYNDPIVKSQFDHRMWIWVSKNFDEVKLTMEMLDFVSKGKHARISSLAKLQEILVSHVASKRCLLVLDDVWDSMDYDKWNNLVAPMRSDNQKSNVILVTTRKLSTANATGTVEPIKLDALQMYDFWLLFKSCTFGDGKHEGHPSLKIIGRQIAEKLHGNPLAAKTVGMLLRVNLTVDHWSTILKNEEWKSLHLSKGIMYALQLSYVELPYHIQRCFSYCSIFPINHQFLGNELVYTWISQGFVKCSHSTERLEDIGHNYFTELLNSCFFKQVETKDLTLGYQTFYVMPALVHEFARLVSGTKCAAIDDLACTEVLPTIRHLSILTYSAYPEDRYGNIPRNEKFEEKLQRVVNSTRKLRTLVLIGTYDYYLFRSLKGIFQKAQNLRMLHMSASYAGFGHSLCNLINGSHFRYLKLRIKEDIEALPEALRKFYHLQVLDINLYRRPNGYNVMENLISLRHLVASKAVHSLLISNIGKMTSLQELHDFNCTSFEIAQLQSMSELAQLGVSQVGKVVTREKADEAKLREKSHLEKLHLSWANTMPKYVYVYDFMRSEPFFNAVEIDTSKQVLEGFEPHPNLKHLQISWYPSSTSPDWLVRTVSATCLQTLHLEYCRELQVLPSLERLPFLAKLKLRDLWKVRQVTIPSLEKLVLIKMLKLERCSCNSVRDFNSSLRVLKVKECGVLKVFPLFESCDKLRIEQKSWLSSLSVLTIHDCPQLTVSHPLPPSSSTCKLSNARVSTLPAMKALSNAEMIISKVYFEGPVYHCDEDCNELVKLDDKILSFHNLRDLTSLQIRDWQNLSCISLRGLRQLISLKSLEIKFCRGLFSLDVLPERAGEDMADVDFIALPALEHLVIESCGITGKWLSVMLQHAPALEELYVDDCDQISGLLIEGIGRSLSSHTCTPHDSSAGNRDGTLTRASPEGLLRIPSNLVSSLNKILILSCNQLTFQGNKEGFSAFTSLEVLIIYGCSELIWSLMKKYQNNDQGDGKLLLPHSLSTLQIKYSLIEALQPCFPEDRNCLRKLEINYSASLKFLQLHSCTALEELVVNDCESLAALEGNLTCLKKLVLCNNSRLKSLQLYSCTALEELTVQYCGSLIALEGNFTCLRKLKLSSNLRLKSLQLHFCTALEHLLIDYCASLDTLEDFRSLRCLRYMDVLCCPGLPPYLESLLTQGYELCTGLERLRIDDPSFLTKSFCKCLTSLQRLEICNSTGKMRGLTDEQERVLQLITSLQELRFDFCSNLSDLPKGLHGLPSLKKLEICSYSGISRLSEKGLPPALEELEISGSYSRELTDACRTLATSSRKPRIKIVGKYVN